MERVFSFIGRDKNYFEIILSKIFRNYILTIRLYKCSNSFFCIEIVDFMNIKHGGEFSKVYLRKIALFLSNWNCLNQLVKKILLCEKKNCFINVSEYVFEKQVSRFLTMIFYSYFKRRINFFFQYWHFSLIGLYTWKIKLSIYLKKNKWTLWEKGWNSEISPLRSATIRITFD